jgi:predicted MFS family arabinose efflux permease
MNVRWWRHAWPGLLATLNGVGLNRFAYTPLIPFMIAAGVVSASGAAYLGAANVMGYLAGAAVAAPLALRMGMATTIRVNFVLTILALAACIVPGGFWWYFPWRFLSGAAGAVLMVLAPSFLLADVPADERGRSGGVIYTGVGAGIALSSLVVPVLAQISLTWAWAALALGALATTVATWPRWRGSGPILAGRGARVRLGLPARLVALAFGMDGIGFIPHMLFWVDYIARTLGLGTTAGATQWLIFGLGAAAGPAIGGAIGDKIGLGRALILVFALKALAVVLPTFGTTMPLLAVSSVIAGAFTPGIAALSAARLTELVAPADQTRAWGLATLVFGVFQAGGAYAMSWGFDRLGSYVPLYAIGAAFEALGAIFAFAALILGNRARPLARNRQS